MQDMAAFVGCDSGWVDIQIEGIVDDKEKEAGEDISKALRLVGEILNNDEKLVIVMDMTKALCYGRISINKSPKNKATMACIAAHQFFQSAGYAVVLDL